MHEFHVMHTLRSCMTMFCKAGLVLSFEPPAPLRAGVAVRTALSGFCVGVADANNSSFFTLILP